MTGPGVLIALWKRARGGVVPASPADSVPVRLATPHLVCPDCSAVDEIDQTVAGTWYCAACGSEDF